MSSLVQTAKMAPDAGKKRKRESIPAGAEKTKKKRVSIREESQPRASSFIRVSNVIKPQFAAPFSATTPGLCVPESIQFDSFARTRNKSSKRPSPADLSAEMLLHSSAHRTVDFTGRENESKSADTSLRHYVGIFDPVTGQLQVVEAKKMEIRGTVRARDATEEQMKGSPIKRTMTDLKNDLGQTFGTKKAKKAIQSLTENAIANRKRNADGSYQAVEMDAGDHALMKTMEAATASMATREELQAAVDKAKPVPRGNYGAEEIQDVYVPSQIIGADVLAAIPVRDWQQAARAGEPIDLYSQFVAQRVSTVAIREDAADKLRLLRYLYWLILYWQSARPGKERGTRKQLSREKLEKQMHGAPDAVIENIRRIFTENGTIRKFHADLIMTHCCLFAALVDNFEVNTFDIREDLRLDQKQINQYFSEIGARIRSVKTEERVSYFAKLALPLQFPRSVRQRKRK